MLSGYSWSQTFPVTGQLASTAFPVCGTDTFKQSIVPIGTAESISIPGCDIYPNKNPFWYSFTCFTGGTLGLLITPNDPGDDYDWMLFDITGNNPDDVYTNTSLIVTGNWSGTSGLTGARTGGSKKIECASFPSDNIPTFSAMPTLITGHKYLLLISHFTDSQSGYSLAFGGGTAVITDPKLPHLQSATMGCDGKSLTVLLNKKMRCGSLALNGSDFLVSPLPDSVISASAMSCTNGFDMETVQLTLEKRLPPGDYSLMVKVGSDYNTLLDDCGSRIEAGEKIDFTVLPPQPTPLDSLTQVTCSPNKLQLVFSNPIRCSTIAPDGSDFTISGNQVVGISGATGNCTNELTSVIDITLSSPIVLGGNYQIRLVTGGDGNTILDECGLETPAGSSIPFSLQDTVSASFSYQVAFGCRYDTILLNYTQANGVDRWQWIIDSSNSNTLFDPAIVFSDFGPKLIQHIVSNGFCGDTAIEMVSLDNAMKAAFQAPREICPKDMVMFGNLSSGNLVSWIWNFGDGTSSNEQTPPEHLYPNTWEGKTYMVSLIVQNNYGCFDTATAQITKLQSCYITVPNAFTPNGDGKNDYLYPLNASMATNLEFMVYNRYGQLVFETKDWSHKWDGTMGGKPQPSGTYVWTLRYTDGSLGKEFFLRGFSVLMR